LYVTFFSREGIYMKKPIFGWREQKRLHCEAEADAKFEAWKSNKQSAWAAYKS